MRAMPKHGGERQPRQYRHSQSSGERLLDKIKQNKWFKAPIK
jgi:hypothetical protein